MSYHVILTAVAIFIMYFGNALYVKDLLRSKTKPHAFTWLVWGILDVVIFAGQITDGAGIASFVALTNGLFALFIFVVTMRQGEKSILISDWLYLSGALIAILLWIFTKDPLLSIILVSSIGLAGFLPMIKKSVKNPHEETMEYFLLQGTRSLLTFIALERFTLVTYLEPALLIFVNFGFALFLIVQRRNYIKRQIKYH